MGVHGWHRNDVKLRLLLRSLLPLLAHFIALNLQLLLLPIGSTLPLLPEVILPRRPERLHLILLGDCVRVLHLFSRIVATLDLPAGIPCCRLPISG